MKNNKKNTIKKSITSILLIVTIISTFAFGGVQAQAATFGTPSNSSVTLYINDSNNDDRIINIPIKSWTQGYTYSAVSNNTKIVKVKNASVNSKTGITFTAQAEYPGSTTISVKMKNSSGKILSTINIIVNVTNKAMPTPTSLSVTNVAKDSVSISYKNTNRAYITGYYIEASTTSTFTSSTTKVYKVNDKNQTAVKLSGLKSGQRYYVRVASISNLNLTDDNQLLISARSSVVRAITK